MPIGLVAIDEAGRIATCNEKAEAILDISCREAAGKQAAAILPAPLQQLIDDLSQRNGLMEKDLQISSGQAADKTLEVVAACLTDDGAATGRIMLFRDVTAIRQLEKEVVKSRHLNSLGSLAAGVAHEIRNPLQFHQRLRRLFKERLSVTPKMSRRGYHDCGSGTTQSRHQPAYRVRPSTGIEDRENTITPI